MKYHIAHIRKVEDVRCDIQTAERHCRRVAQYAAARLERVGLAAAGYLAGLIHDMGKYTEKFAAYIKGAAGGETVKRGSVNHSFAAVIFLFERYHGKACETERDVACEVLAYATGAHHGQFDCIDPAGKSGFSHRLNADRAAIGYEEAKANFLAECAGYAELDRLFDAACAEIGAFTDRILAQSAPEQLPGSELQFSLSFLCRLLLSAVIDADRRDTAEFMEDISFPTRSEDAEALWGGRLAFMEEKLPALGGHPAIGAARREISDLCRRAAGENGGGIFRLAVPTGSGKTLSSLRYALRNAQLFHKDRLVFVIPLLTIIEQNADVLREYLGESGLVLEHHSDIVRTQEDGDKLDERELLTEDWCAPVIITTMVQFLNTLFLGRTASVRRLCALCNSVIVIDEIQSVPGNMIALVTAALNFLAGACGATVVLSSATQPDFGAVPRRIRYADKADLVPYDARLWAPFRRTELRDVRRPSGYTFEELAAFLLERMSEAESLLCICNTKTEARRIYERLSGAPGRDFELFHLSAAMCKAHRSEVLAQINARLARGARTVCVATQLVEAGVDFSFSCVVRILAGMENAAQAAGRCNRNGEFGRLCPVYLINLQNEDLNHLPDIRRAQDASGEFLEEFARDPGRFGGDMLSDGSIRHYYGRLFFSMAKDGMDFPLPERQATIYDLLAENEAFRPRGGGRAAGMYYIGQAFKTAGDGFRVFPEATEEVVVPYGGEARALIADLCSERAKRDMAYLKQKLTEAKRYTVSIFEYQKRWLSEKNALHTGPDDAFLTLADGFYSHETGLDEAGCSGNTYEGGMFG